MIIRVRLARLGGNAEEREATFKLSRSGRKAFKTKSKLMRVHGVQKRPLNDDRNE